MKILVINPGGTSTKVAVYENEQELWKTSIQHDYESLRAYPSVVEQLPYRKQRIIDTLLEAGYTIDLFDVVVGRGGLMKPVVGGTYAVNQRMVDDLTGKINGEHASNLGAILAFEIGKERRIPGFIVDPVATDEFMDISRITGISDIEKASWLHALNIKAVCRKVSKKIGTPYEKARYIVSHLGSGLSHVAHCEGRMIDGSGGRSDGPFSPERSGGLPTFALVNLCYSGTYTHKEMIDKISNRGGMYDYLGTKDMKWIEERAIEGHPKCKLILDAFCYQVAKEICSYAATLEGRVDRIIVTGGIARSDYVLDYIQKHAGWLAPIEVVPGELEMEALALGALRVMRGEEESKVYT